MRGSRSWITLALAVVAALAVLAGIGVIARRKTEQRAVQPTAAPLSITAVASDVRVFPAVSAKRRLEIVTDLGRQLTKLYTATFVTPKPPAEPTPTPTGVPVDRLRGLFTPVARSSLHQKGRVWTPPRGLDIAQGRIAFSGVVTVDGTSPVESYVNVEFLGTADRVRVRQKGRLYLVKQKGRWLVQSYALHLATEQIPEPTPTP